MRVVFLGTPDFAVGVLKHLVDSKHEVVAVIAQPDRAKDRKGNYIAVPVKVFAQQKNIPIYQFNKIKDVESIDIIKKIPCDIMVTAAYGQILNREILDIAPHGIVNVHASLLPKYRGASPVQSAILNGESHTGVTIMRTEEGLDTGNIISSTTVEIGKNENSETLLQRLSDIGGELLVDTLTKIENGQATEQKQDELLATKCRLLKKEDGKINWQESNDILHNKVRALISWPTAYTYFGEKTLKIFETEIVDSSENLVAGQIIDVNNKGIVVACGSGCLLIKSVQLEGKNKMSACDFARGYRIKTGDYLGNIS